MSAYVEVVFDNTDGRFPVRMRRRSSEDRGAPGGQLTRASLLSLSPPFLGACQNEKEEVRLRRTVGLKKDEYSVNGKTTPRTEVVSLLESAGFSRSNPYYVVQQGKITAMAMMKDSQRLELLKEVGGTHVYEERRAESLRILNECDARRAAVDDALQLMEQRLQELDAEAAELRQFNALDGQRKALEYALYQAELASAQQQAAASEQARAGAAASGASAHDAARSARERVAQLEGELAAAERAAEKAASERAACDAHRASCIAASTAAQLDAHEAEEAAQAAGRQRDSLSQEKATVEEAIAAARAELAALQPGCEAASRAAADAAAQVTEAEQQMSQLVTKQGRAAQFKTKEERDASIDKELEPTRSALAKKAAALQAARGELARLQAEAERHQQQVTARLEALSARDASAASAVSAQRSAEQRRDSAMAQRKEAWRSADAAQERLASASAAMRSAEEALEQHCPRDVQRGLASLKRLTQSLGLGDSVHGSLIELLDCDDKFHAAVEAVAGNQLFHVVVDTDATASALSHQLVHHKGGRLTFMPLNRLQPPPVVDTPAGGEAVPLLSKLRFVPTFAPAFKHVFGRALVCKDLDAACRLAAQAGSDCVTLDGDAVSRKGSLEGGYTDSRRSRLAAFKAIKAAAAAFEKASGEVSKADAAVASLEAEVNAALSELARLQDGRMQDAAGAQAVRAELEAARQAGRSASERASERADAVAALQAELAALQAAEAALVAERASPMSGSLTQREQQQLAELRPRLATLQRTAAQLASTAAEQAAQLAALTARLTNNLERRAAELDEQMAALGGGSGGAAAAEAAAKRDAAAAAVAAADAAVADSQAAERLVETAKAAVAALRRDLQAGRAARDAAAAQLQDVARDSEAAAASRARAQRAVEELTAKIGALGSLPSEALQQHRGTAVSQLTRQLAKVSAQLKAFSGRVNRKALDQYVSFQEQRQQLLARRQEDNQARDKITELIDTLDQRKDESIERTFKQVALNFRQVFASLVQGGSAQLVMQRKRGADGPPGDGGDEDGDGDGDGENDAPQQPPGSGRVDKYSGVKIKVNFGSGWVTQLERLSGGQKTVMALAFIFAIQRCDPAPFYLFDEIDAALDAQHRAAVAKLVSEDAAEKKTQFIATTFRPELVAASAKVYGVSHAARISRVDVITKQAALQFIGDQAEGGLQAAQQADDAMGDDTNG